MVGASEMNPHPTRRISRGSGWSAGPDVVG